MQTSLSIRLFNDSKSRQCEVQLRELCVSTRRSATLLCALLLLLLRAIGETSNDFPRDAQLMKFSRFQFEFCVH